MNTGDQVRIGKTDKRMRIKARLLRRLFLRLHPCQPPSPKKRARQSTTGFVVLFLSLMAPQLGNATSYAPCSHEKTELKASTPLRPVAISSTLSTMVAALAVALEQGPLNERSPGLKQGFGIGVLAVNYLLSVPAGVCNPSESNFSAPALSENDRTAVRDSFINQTYIIGGLQMVLATTLLIVAENPPSQIISGLAVSAPLVASLIWRERFTRGPALQHKASSQPEVSIRFAPGTHQWGLVPMLAASLRF